jgi:hypothetical protein
VQPVGIPGGPDWTRGLRPRSEIETPRMEEILRASAYGRARGRLNEALEEPDLERREALIQRLVLQLIDFALEGADVRTILNGLV